MAQTLHHHDTHPDTHQDSMRVDKWLWAARFFKTRSIAKAAIEGGKVHHEGERVKVSKEIRIGMELTIQQGLERKTVTVKALSAVRGGAPQAQLLYEETPTSVARQELLTAQRKLHNLARPDHRPSKKDRRHIHRFQQDNASANDIDWYAQPDSH